MGVYRARVLSTFAAGGGTGVNTWCLRTTGVGGDSTNISSLMGIIEAWYTALAPLVPATTRFSWDGAASELGTLTPEYRQAGTGWFVDGSATGTAYGAAAGMICVTWRTSLATRRGRGRTFIGPLAAAAIEPNGSVEPGTLGGIRGASTDLVESSLSDTDGGAIAVWSSVDGVARDVVAATVTDQIAVLRSRRN